MRTRESLLAREARKLLPARHGHGPLLERDYWAVIDGCRLRPSELAAEVAAHFAELPAPDLVDFRRSDDRDAPLERGDEMEVRVRGAGTFGVRVVHRGRCSLTIATLAGHPEAGRITFGAYRNERGDVIFHIRSRARSSTRLGYVGFLGVGEAMQTFTWTDFINTVAVRWGEGVIGFVHAERRRVSDEGEEAHESPTYLAEAD